MPFRVLVIGPGAIGRALGGVLERGGAQVETRIAPGQWVGSAQMGRSADAGERARQIAATLSAHGLVTVAEPEMWPLLWRKVAISCGVNALTALEGCTNGDLLERPAA